jgi:putative ABC transport system permease protein
MVIMVASFRDSLNDWLSHMLPADVYLRASAASASGFLDDEAVARIAALPGVVSVRPVRFERLRDVTDGRPVSLIARPVQGSAGLPLVSGSLQPPAHGIEARPAWISEAMADRTGQGVGAPLQLAFAGEIHAFEVVGIWRDYARQEGAVVIELDDFRALTGDARTNDLGLFLAPGTDPASVMDAVRATLGERVTEMILPDELRAMILGVFDRTFLVTYLMQAVAVLIGLFGIGTTFAALATSRRKEFGILRHLGLTRGQIGALLATESALIAAVGVTVGVVGGGAIALVLIEVINRQSFHWSMDIQIPFATLLTFCLAMVALAGLAARLSGAQAMQREAVLAVREDW